MEWWWILLIIFLALVGLMAVGLPVAFAFLTINIVGVYIFWNGAAGLTQLVLSIYESVTSFALLPVPLFVLMGEIMFRSGIATRQMEVLDAWLGRVPGRLSLLAVGGGTLFATLTGSAMAGAAMLGSTLVPEMEKKGYSKAMSLGPILGSGGLAIMIPPSALGVLLAALGEFSIGRFLVAILIPGCIMALLYAGYIIIRCQIQPRLAPKYTPPPVAFFRRLWLTFIYVLPMGLIVFLVVGLIFLGIATPTESAAAGTLGCFILAGAYRRLRWEVVRKATEGTLRVTVMMFMILAGSTAFSQILAFTGASTGLVEMATHLPIQPIMVIIVMQFILFCLGTFMEPLSIMMLTIPIYFPIIQALGYSPLWFGTIMLLNMEMATTSPPFGLVLFVMKSVAPKETTMADIYRAALPFLACDALAMIAIMAFPALVLWLPGLM
ncbi:MAG: TRAP transporter large permease subunit [Desulfobacterales bacterium]|jgi:tripartite ATP-independent transporter DctM subunit